MKKQAHQLLIEYFINIIPKYKKEVIERQRQTDNVVIWLTGISTAAIALFFLHANNISFIPPVSVKITVLFLLCTIISGVTFRAFIYVSEQIESELCMRFEGYCYGVLSEYSGPIEITEHHTIEQIAESLKNDMGLNYDEWLKHEYLDRNFWVDHYNKWAHFWKNSEKEGLKGLENALAPLLGKKPEETEGLFLKNNVNANKKAAQKAIRLRYICNRAYNYMLIFFCLAVLTPRFLNLCPKTGVELHYMV